MLAENFMLYKMTSSVDPGKSIVKAPKYDKTSDTGKFLVQVSKVAESQDRMEQEGHCNTGVPR